MAAPTVGLALIARDEEANLPGLLMSIVGAFDQVVLLDTGSTDRTIEFFTKWAEHQSLPLGYKVDTFEWCDDFAAARNAADALLTTDWLTWADCDDEIVGAEHLRPLAAEVPPRIVGLGFLYDYFPEVPRGVGQQVYIRMARRGKARWTGRVHEGWKFGPGDVVQAKGPFLWRHRAKSLGSHRVRNLRILRDWVSEEPDNPAPLGLLAFEEMCCGHRDEMIELCRTFLERFGDRLTDEQRAVSDWALHGLELSVDTVYPLLLDGADKLLQMVLGPVANIHSQAHSDLLRSRKSALMGVSPGSDPQLVAPAGTARAR